MATIEEVIQKTENRSILQKSALAFLKKNPAFIPEVFKPLLDAGFIDFTCVGQGKNSFFIAPGDNANIVFRVTNERIARENNNPFFLCGGYRQCFTHASGSEISLEILLAGNTATSEKDRSFLVDEMKKAGWHPEKIAKIKELFDDVILLSCKDSQGRARTVPIISDPSALGGCLEEAWPSRPLQLAQHNRCSASYITLQDQAAAYNVAIAGDIRLQKLIPNRLEFPQTEVIPVQAVSLLS